MAVFWFNCNHIKRQYSTSMMNIFMKMGVLAGTVALRFYVQQDVASLSFTLLKKTVVHKRMWKHHVVDHGIYIQYIASLSHCECFFVFFLSGCPPGSQVSPRKICQTYVRLARPSFSSRCAADWTWCNNLVLHFSQEFVSWRVFVIHI